jgi:mannose-6-phosphate isomerase-like protein (cupin superfamily)
MPTDASNRLLDFAPLPMRWEILNSTADTSGEFFETINVVDPGMGGPPLHVHPTAEESYQVLEGTLDVCIDGEWRTVTAGAPLVVPAGTPHTLKNAQDKPVKLINIHRPAMDFERFFRRLHALVVSGQASLPPKGFGSLVRLSMLFVEHKREIKSVKPPHGVMRFFAFIGRRLGYKLPE